MIDRSPPLDEQRLLNALVLFDEFARTLVVDPARSDVQGLERRFAEKMRISPSYWSLLKARARHINEKLARQFEVHGGKTHGWLDQSHAQATRALQASTAPTNDDERFVVGTVLTAYRMDPSGVKQLVLEMLERTMAKSLGAAGLRGGPPARVRTPALTAVALPAKSRPR